MLIRAVGSNKAIPSLGLAVAVGEPIEIENDLAQRLIEDGGFEEVLSADIHPAGNKNITKNGRHTIAEYQTVTVKCEAVMLTFNSDLEENIQKFMPVVKGDTVDLFTKDDYSQIFPDVVLPEGQEFKGWALESQSTLENIVDDEYEVMDNTALYAVYGEPEEEEEINNNGANNG